MTDWYKIKRILVGTQQVYPAQTVQTFDFQNNWALNWTWYSIGYWTPDYVTGQWWKIWSGSGGYQWWIKPPTSIFQWTLKRIKIYWYKPWTITSSSWWGAWICNTSESNIIEYWRNGTSRIFIVINGTEQSSISATDITWEITSEYILEDNWHITLKLNWTSYDVWNYANNFQTLWENKALQIEIGTWTSFSTRNYIRKVEITTK